MHRKETIVIGGGQAGLAMSRCLTDRGIDHVVFERGRLAERWRSERWNSLRLLTPSWQTRLPGFRYRGPSPDGYLTMPETIALLEDYAASFHAPVKTETTVLSVAQHRGSYRVVTDQGTWQAECVVVATGHAATPHVPSLARALPDGIEQIVPTRYRSAAQLSSGGVLIVGASASGVQLADEIRGSGREVHLSVGRHTGLPRRYRGQDIMWWLDRTGTLARRWDEVRDIHAERRAPSLQLLGSDDGREVDLPSLRRRGVHLYGRTVGVEGHALRFASDLGETTRGSRRRVERILSRIDRLAGSRGPRPESGPAGPSPTRLDLKAAGIETVIWATGFRRRYEWLEVPVLDERGEILHHGGVTPAPGLYVLGLQFLRRRNSAFIDGVGDDAEALAAHLHAFLGGPQRAAA